MDDAADDADAGADFAPDADDPGDAAPAEAAPHRVIPPLSGLAAVLSMMVATPEVLSAPRLHGPGHAQ